MDSARWQRIQALFHAAADLSGSEQQAFLKAECGNDPLLQAEVLAMLEEDARQAPLLDRNLAEVAHSALGEADPALPLKEFGPYRVLRLLGEGGMGVVYLAERKDLGTRVAIKVLRDAWLSPARRERFAREQRTLAQLNHPSIARLYDADILPDGTPWFVMEHVEGLRLTDYCRERNCSIDDRLQLFRAVCEAVQYAHGQAVIHRDLKPSNILVKNDGAVRLLDFGIAKQLETFEDPAEQTMTGLRLMTPAYAAPEQILGGTVGVHTDVYSLGVILYELLTGRLPFNLSSLTPAEAATLITDGEPAKPSATLERTNSTPVPEGANALPGPAAWADLDVLALTAMHRDPLRRYRSAEALIRDIDHYLKGEPLEARPDALSYRMSKFVGRNRRALTAAALVFAVVVGLVVFFTVRLAKARTAALDEAARTQRIQRFMMNLFRGGDEAAGPADDLKVVTLLDRGVQEARALDREPAVQAELYQTLGSMYEKLGKFDRADSMLQAALDERKSVFGANSSELARSEVSLALLRADQAQYDEAQRLAEDGLAVARRTLPPNDPGIARATFVVGKVLEDRGRYDQAIRVLDDAVRLQSGSGVEQADLAASLSELANSHFYVGHYDISEALNRRVLAINSKLYGDRHPMVADTLINLGAIEFQRGRYPESERYNRQALDIIQSWYGPVHPETADAMTILGQSLTYQKRFDEANALLHQSLAILEQVYGHVHPRVGYALNELGNVAIRQGKLDDAEADFKRVVSIYRSVYGENHYQIGIALSNLGGVYAERKDYVQAEKYFRDALQVYSKSLRPDHLSVGVSRVRLGNALLGEHRDAEAEVESRTGYEILMKQTSPTVKWIQMARSDLAQEYDALKQPEKAAAFRAPLATASNNSTASARN